MSGAPVPACRPPQTARLGLATVLAALLACLAAATGLPLAWSAPSSAGPAVTTLRPASTAVSVRVRPPVVASTSRMALLATAPIAEERLSRADTRDQLPESISPVSAAAVAAPAATAAAAEPTVASSSGVTARGARAPPAEG